MRRDRLPTLLAICGLFFASVLRADGETGVSEPVRVPSVKVVHVIVGLCDRSQPGMEQVPPSLGNGTDPSRNLYWGAQFGLKTWFRSQAAWTQVRPREGEIATPHPAVLKRIVFFHKETSTYLVADAYDGTRVREAIRDVLFPRPGDKVEGLVARPIYLGAQANLRAYVGYNALGDNPLQTIPTPRHGTIRPGIFLTGTSETTFAPFLEQAELWMLLGARERIEPEAYTLEAAILAWAEGSTPEEVLAKAAEAYAYHQELEVPVAAALFVHGTPPPDVPPPDPGADGENGAGSIDTSAASVDDPGDTGVTGGATESPQPGAGVAEPRPAPDTATDPPPSTPPGEDGTEDDTRGTETGSADVPATEASSPAEELDVAGADPRGGAASVPDGADVPETIRALPLPPAYRTADPDTTWTAEELAWRAYILDLPIGPVPAQTGHGTAEPEGEEVGTAPEADIPEDAEAVLGVVRWPTPHRLQQSAGVAIRAYALFRRARGLPVSFHSMSGDEMEYGKWLAGRYRISEDGARILYDPDPAGQPPREDTDEEFDRYLIYVMTYTNVTSLLRDVPRVPEGMSLRWGDLYIQPPGRSHRGQVSLLLQKAAGVEDGTSRLYLFGGGGSPARAFEVYRARPGEGYGHWFSLEGFFRRMDGYGEGSFHRFPLGGSGE